jgi:hypothetical protein
MLRWKQRRDRQLGERILSKIDGVTVDLPQHLLKPWMADSPIVVRMWQFGSGEDREARNK